MEEKKTVQILLSVGMKSYVNNLPIRFTQSVSLQTATKVLARKYYVSILKHLCKRINKWRGIVTGTVTDSLNVCQVHNLLLSMPFR